MTDKKLTPQYLIAGGITGWIEAFSTWPAEYMKTQMQLKQNEKSMAHFFNALKGQVKRNGFLSLYKGITPVLVIGIPKSAIRFSVYEKTNQSLANPFLSGIIAGGIESALVGIPSETLKTRIIEKNCGLKEAMKGGLYSGSSATIIRHSLTQGSRFVAFSQFKKYSDNNFLGGVFAGVVSVYGSQPFDVIKTRKQGKITNNVTNTEIAKDIYRELGMQGFWKGSFARLLRVAPGQGIVFFSYGKILEIVEKIFN